MEGERTGYMEFTGIWRGNLGVMRDLGGMMGKEREVSAGTSSGGLQVGSTSRWTDAPRLVELGGRSGYNRERVKRS